MKALLCYLAVVALANLPANAAPIALGSANTFAVLAGSTVTNTGPSLIHGNLGVSPGTAITGFGPGLIADGSLYAGGAVAEQAQRDLITAYGAAAALPCGTVLTGTDLGGLTLDPGVYCFATSAQLTGKLTLDGLGDPNAQFVFQIGSTLTTASASSVLFVAAGSGNDVFWQVGSSATLGSTTDFAGNILALASITLNTGADIRCGRALARNGAATLDTNIVSADIAACGTAPTPVAEPAPVALLGLGLAAALAMRRWRRWRGGSAAIHPQGSRRPLSVGFSPAAAR